MAAKHIQLSIPEPCHEKWSAMTPVDEHRAHCKSCDRVLTDFSQMSDTELALWFVHNKGKLCGRFANHQLNRDLLVPVDQPKKKHWLSALWLLPLAAFAKPASAQGIEKSKPPVTVKSGESSVPQAKANAGNGERIVKGQLVDADTKEPLVFALVSIKAENGDSAAYGTQTDIDGNFMLKIPAEIKRDPVIVFSYVGYQRREILATNFTDGTVTMHPDMQSVTLGIIIETPQERDTHRFWSKLRLTFALGGKKSSDAN